MKASLGGGEKGERLKRNHEPTESGIGKKSEKNKIEAGENY